MLDTVIAAYRAFKLMLIDATGLTNDALHVHFGLTILLATRLVWRWRGGWLVAWLAALAFALAGEFFDLRGEQARGFAVPLSAHWHDIWNTLLWPSIAALIGWRINRRSAAPSGDDAEQPLEQS